MTKSVNGVVTDYRYADGTDRLLSYGNESFVYDGMGNPTKYRDMECTWEKGRQLKQISDGENTVSFTYDVFGMRTSKTVGNLTTNYIYENGKLLRQKTGNDTIDFIYGRDGVIGVTLNNVPYLYRKNLFGDVTEIYDQNGNVVGKYSYSAFGECSIELDTDSIATKNPIRYRGYYYDEELNLYYLKSRYYDPEVGRFITIDDLSYLDPENINGLNLYAYCGNDPVMYVDPDGNSLIAIFLVLAGCAIAGAALGGKMAYDNGARGWGLFGKIMLGAAIGLAVGGAFVAGVAVGFGALGVATVFGGVPVAQAFAIGALAFDFFAFVVAPIIGVTMDGIEYGSSTPDIPELPTVSYAMQGLKTSAALHSICSLRKYKKEYSSVNDRISWRNVRRLSALYT